MDTREYMQSNRDLEMKYASAFRTYFQRNIHNYMNYLTGFDIVKFDRDINTPMTLPGISTSMWVQQQYGAEAVSLIRKLIS